MLLNIFKNSRHGSFTLVHSVVKNVITIRTILK